MGVLPLLLVAGLLGAVACEKRLISLNETHSVWLNERDVDKLTNAPHFGKGFMDITDHQAVQPVDSTLRAAIPVDPRFPTEVQRIQGFLKVQPIVDSGTHLSAYTTRYYTSQPGLQAAHWIRSRFVELARGRNDVTVELFTHSWLQPSVVAVLKGTASNAEDGIVIIGAHEDSTSNGATAPGADDNASGTSSLLEAFSAMMQAGFKPDRSIHFHTYAAEEAGLRGSQDIAQAYAARGVKVAGMLNMDMTGYNPNNRNMMSVLTDFTSVPLSAFLRKLIAAYTAVRNTDSRCGYACSDHASWSRAGYAASMSAEAVFGQHNPNIHTVRDTMQFVSGEYAMEFSKLAVGFAVEMSMN